MSENIEKHNQRLPLWMLNPAEEKEARQNLKKFAYAQCVDYVEAMVECSKIHGLKVFPACNEPRDAMRKCILSYQGDSYLDVQRDLMVQQKLERLEQQLAEQKKQQQQQQK
ncbi:COX assembly mitochondrial protein [Kluyveromyces marxianus]